MKRINTSLNPYKSEFRYLLIIWISTQKEIEEGDWVAGVEASLNDHNERLEVVEDVHQSEQTKAEKAEEKKEAEAESMRKFRWSMIFFGVTALIDLLLKLVGLPR